jgi:hypothetical protein
MRGFIRRRGEAWELRVYLGQDAITGKKRYATRSVRGSRRLLQPFQGLGDCSII